MKSIQRVLIANRGEIAVRIIRTCKEMGLDTIAVYSEADKHALHAQIADESYLLGPAPAGESYLNIDKIISIARRTHCDAVHPGYGFLSENADFAEVVTHQRMVFVGPPGHAIRAMGDKTEGREMVRRVGVPVVPGSDQVGKYDDDLAHAARDLGYPVLVKAAAGGGGKGMRVVRSPSELSSAVRGARSESLSAFGDSRIYLEKYLKNPCHIEFQILADVHGNVVHLGERECSIQRRHQKIIEETPSAHLSKPSLRKEMAKAAVLVAKSCGYVNAGTVEFLLDEDGNFYFLEMNTRLQVEHPVTEMVTGIDIVSEQMKIAQGERLSCLQEDIQHYGHAIECRVYAEDPFNYFFPSTGKITRYRSGLGPGVREDCGVEEGTELTVHYDPLMSKLISWSGTRQGAISRMKRALQEYQLSGVETTIPFCVYVMEHPIFQAGTYDTSFVEYHFQADSEKLDEDLSLVAAMTSACFSRWKKATSVGMLPSADGRPASRWKLKRLELDDWTE